ncbi:MAG: electron transport complex subunit RsxA [Turicibacter sanguinis]|jgi:electron transport complex, rnfABCDGE type, A subunit|uniref:Ion-translocating oxidoreductase complex subunit A n=2 Tax=Turicibacter sanguinis TaxID=154288 RepID=A0A9X4XEG1_9FIRM|nr:MULTISPECIES: electron transport complex subunit RsxA [Turicibacter]EFF64641.1 electron transport complex, RnfABCDGE type, A subunit [Turicibacter sanguinis PC909]EGC93237.1 electron transport complex protein, RnfABCDGE type, A subunit [Turicibacter sp. HGF1]MBP3905132.1 electron transport complex subunit RsxA [Turicibacter sp.]MCU7191289.1 electron transport complex subunit RsxA [Turicibacter sanguinis]MCU7196167.1 electron transport complex subunit RsxA [Turicibacter sanguinis]
METLVPIALTALLVQNVILSQFFGICPFIGVSKKTESAIGMGLAVTFVMVVSSSVSWLVYEYILVPCDMTYMRTITFILVISSLVQFVEMVVKKFSPKLYKLLGVYLPLITTNCAVLGIAVLSIDNQYNLIETIVFSLFSALGFTLVIYLFSVIRERLELAPIPEALRGVPIALITASIMSIIFMGFGGIV